MKIFISHSGKDVKMAKVLSAFLESIDYNINVFCSSQIGNIKYGSDYVNAINEKLQECEIFIPLLTKSFYESRYCMVELGFAYSNLSAKSMKFEGDYIYPLAVLPVKKAEALMHTPLERIQVCSVNDAEEMRAYIETVCENRAIMLGSGLNRKIHSFICEINEIIYSTFDALSNSKILLCKAGNVTGEDKDYLEYSLNADNSGYTFNFRAKPFENSTIYSEFLSVVFQYVDKINLYDVVNIYPETKLLVQINNYSNSISKIDIEIKHSGTNLLHRQTVNLGEGENNIVIPLKEIKYEALKSVSEICFVIKPSAYIEDEGMFQIKHLMVMSKE